MAVERTRAICPPTHRTHKQRQAAVSACTQQGLGRCTPGAGNWEKPRGQMLNLGPGVGMQSFI